MVLVAVEQILCEMLAAPPRRAEILGPSLDLGGNLAAIVRMVAPNEMEMLIRMEPRLAAHVPPVDGPAERLGRRLASGEFRLLAAAMAREVIRELKGAAAPAARRRPGRDRHPAHPGHGPDGDHRPAAVAGGGAGRLRPAVKGPGHRRFRRRLRRQLHNRLWTRPRPWCGSARTSPARPTSAPPARWLSACVGALRFETEQRGGPPNLAAQRLAALAVLQKGVRAAALGDKDEAEISGRIGAVAGLVEADAKLVAQVAKSPLPPVRRLSVLLKLAGGETAPFGPVADRARAEAIRIFKTPDARAALSAEPGALAPLRPLMKAAGLAA